MHIQFFWTVKFLLLVSRSKHNRGLKHCALLTQYINQYIASVYRCSGTILPTPSFPPAAKIFSNICFRSPFSEPLYNQTVRLFVHSTPAWWISPRSHDRRRCGLPTLSSGLGVSATADNPKEPCEGFQPTAGGLSAGLGEKRSIREIKVPQARRIRLWVRGSWDCVDPMCHSLSRLEWRGGDSQVSSRIYQKGSDLPCTCALKTRAGDHVHYARRGA